MTMSMTEVLNRRRHDDNDESPDSLFDRFSWTEFVYRPNPEPPDKPDTYDAFTGLPPAARREVTAARVEYCSARRVLHTPSTEAFLVEARSMLASNELEPNAAPGLLLTGKFASGKTTIATHYAREYHIDAVKRYGGAIQLDDVIGVDGTAAHVPVAYIKVTDKMTPKQAAAALSWFYGVDPGKRTRLDIVLAVTAIMYACRTRLLIVDDAHRLIGNGDINGFLKDLADLLPVTIVLIHGGDPNQIDAYGPEMLERLTIQHLKPVPAGTPWKKLVRLASTHIDLYHHQPDDLTAIADLLYARTDGWVSTLATLLRKTTVRAIQTGEERITPKLLKAVAASKNADDRWKARQTLDAAERAAASN